MSQREPKEEKRERKKGRLTSVDESETIGLPSFQGVVPVGSSEVIAASMVARVLSEGGLVSWVSSRERGESRAVRVQGSSPLRENEVRWSWKCRGE